MKQTITGLIFPLLLCTVFFFPPWGGMRGAAQYCIPQFSSLCSSDDYLDGVQFAGIYNSSTGCNGNANNYIYDTSDTAYVLPGNTYQITVAPSTLWQQGIGVWIDYNHDYDFSDSGEFVFTTPPGTAPVSGNISIPFSPYYGLTRIRFRAIYAITPSASDSCSIQSYGETEDYPIVIISTTNNVGVIKLVTPHSSCNPGTAEPVTVIVKNFGLDTLTGFPISYIFNNDTIVEIFSDTLFGTDTALFTFVATVDLSVTGSYTFKVFTSLPGDLQPSNDGITKTIAHKTFLASFPYLENFESFFAFNSGNPGPPPLNLVNNWENDQDDDALDWAARSAPTITPLTGPDYDHTYGNDGNDNIGKFIYVEDNYNANPVNLISPCFDITAVNNPYLGFWYHVYNGQDTSIKSLLHIDAQVQGGWVTDIIQAMGPVNIDQWLYLEINLNPYKGIMGIRFRVDNDNGYSFTDVAIDDVSVFNKVITGSESTALNSEAESTMIFPNPVSGKATVTFNYNGLANETASLRLFNIAGEVIADDVMRATKEIDFSKMAGGVYYLQVVAGENIFMRKIVVMR